MTVQHSFLYINGWQAWYRCADPGIFIRGWGEGPGKSDKKALSTIFLVLSLFYRSQMVNFKESIVFQGSSWVQFFPGGPTFSRGCPIAYSL